VPAPGAAVRTASLLGLEARGIEGRVVENAYAGSIYVVSGHLTSPPDAAWAAYGTIEVQLIGSGGASIAHPAVPAAAPLDEAVIRELPPDRIQHALEVGAPALLWPPLGPGEIRPFQAVFARVPPEATDFTLRAVALAPPSAEGPPEGGSVTQSP
jgi:hypothetical protein